MRDFSWQRRLREEAGSEAPSGGPAPASSGPPPVETPPPPAAPPTASMLDTLNSLTPQEEHPAPGEPQPPVSAPPASPDATPAAPGAEATPAAPETPAADASPDATPAAPAAKDPLDEIDPDEIDFSAMGGEEKAPETSPEAKETPEFTVDADKDAEGKQLLAEMDLSGDLTDEQADAVRGAFLKTARGQRMLESHRTLRDLGKPIEEGGLGYVPTREEIVDLHAKAQSNDKFSRDLENLTQDPESVNRVLAHLIGTADSPAAGGDYLALNVPRHLATNNPRAFYAMEAGFLRGLAARLPQMANNSTDAGEKKFFDQLGSAINYFLDPKAAQAAPGSPSSPPAVEESAEMKRLREENDQYRRTVDQTRAAEFQAFENDFGATVRTKIDGMINHAFRNVDLKSIYGESVIAPFMEQQVTGVLKAVLDNQQISESVEQELQDVYRSGRPQDVEQVVSKVLRYADPYVRQTIRRMQNELKRTQPSSAPTDDDAKREAYQQQQNGAVPETPGATPAPGGQAPAPWAPGKESQQDAMLRQLQNLGIPV